jgi:hypothetical protein
MAFQASRVTDDYLATLIDRLRQSGFRVRESIRFRDSAFACCASKTHLYRQELVTFIRTTVVVSKLGRADFAKLKAFSAQAFRYTNRTYGLLPPYGLFYATECFAVAIVDSIDSTETVAAIENYRHRHWAAAEILVVFNKNSNKLHYRTAPYFGLFMNARSKAFIEAMLTPTERQHSQSQSAQELKGVSNPPSYWTPNTRTVLPFRFSARFLLVMGWCFLGLGLLMLLGTALTTDASAAGGGFLTVGIGALLLLTFRNSKK